MSTQPIIISPTDSHQRLDKFLAEFDASESRAAWQKLIKKGKILVNGRASEGSYLLKEGEEITILPQASDESDKKTRIPDIPIIYEDADVIVMDKPTGVISQRADSSDAPAVTDFLENHYPPIKEVGETEKRSGLVHRLDKDTSGLLLAAKNQDAFDFFKAEFKNREVRKIYTALVYGRIEPPMGEINLAIGRNPKSPCRQTTVKNPDSSGIKSRPARTLYETLRNYPGFSLLSVELKTGRMHQIRVHMKAVGHPVAGDAKYANLTLLSRTPELRRQFLHASELRIALPNGQNRTFRSELPADLKAYLQILSDLD
jgi:23S rRNA pseudouridine1911/1915/1917 synthase